MLKKFQNVANLRDKQTKLEKQYEGAKNELKKNAQMACQLHCDKHR